MTARRIVTWVARGFLIALAATFSGVGCSDQGEGERCDLVNAGDSDCQEGLKCIRCELLVEATVDRCCPEEGAETDARCRRSATRQTCGVDTGEGGEGSGGTTSRGGSTSSGGSAQGGSTGSGGSGNAGEPSSGAGGAPDGAGGG